MFYLSFALARRINARVFLAADQEWVTPRQDYQDVPLAKDNWIYRKNGFSAPALNLPAYWFNPYVDRLGKDMSISDAILFFACTRIEPGDGRLRHFPPGPSLRAIEAIVVPYEQFLLQSNHA